MRMNGISYASLVLSVVFFSCSSPETNYGDAGATETVNADWGSTDLQLSAEKMVNSLLQSAVLEPSKRPAIALGSIDNRTNEHIDNQLILDKITTALTKSGRVRIIASGAGQTEISQQIAHQQSGAVSAATAKAFGKQVGADYVMYGRLTNIEKRGGSTEDVYFNFTLHLVNVETAVIEWQDEKEIRKTTKKSKFGW